MNNDFSKSQKIFNSNFDITSNPGKELNQPILQNLLTESIKKESNIIQKIENMQKKIFRLYHDRFGKDFLSQKPSSVLLFQKRLKNYLFSPQSKFLNNFPFIQKKIQNEINKMNNMTFNNKIDIGAMTYYSLTNKNKKDEFFNDNNKEKYLEKSKNFSSVPTKDIINSQFYKVKYFEKNSKRIGKILINKLIRNNISLSRNKSNESMSKVENDNNYFKYKSDIIGHQKIININTENKKDESNNSINNGNDSSFLAKSPSFESKKILRAHSRNISNKTKYNSFNNLYLNNLTGRKNPSNKINKNNLNNSGKKSKNINTLKFEISSGSKTLTSPNRKIISGFWQTNPNINMHKNSIRKNLFKKLKDRKKIYLIRNNNKSRNVFNSDFIKKKSLTYKKNIDNNIDNLNEYTKTCNSLLLKLVQKNKIKGKKYLNINRNDEDKEMKEILSYKNKNKENNEYIKNKLREEKLNKIKVLTNDTILDYNINKLLKEKKNFERIKQNNDIIKRINLFSENINFDEEDYKEHKLEGPLSDRDKNRRINKYNKLREIIEKNYVTIKKLKNFIEIEKDKLIKYSNRKLKENNESL